MAAGIAVGSALVGAAANMASTNMQINETQRENTDQITEYQAQELAAKKASSSKAMFSSEANAYDASVAAVDARAALGSSKAKAGYSGVRGTSPLLALKQQEDQGRAAVAEQIKRGNDSLTQQALESSLLTEEYERKVAKLKSDNEYMDKNRWKYVGLSALGGVAQVGSTLSKYI